MSLFTVLKYSSINIGSEEDLSKLPEGIIDAYWVNTNNLNPGAGDSSPVPLKRKIRGLRLWYGDDSTEYEKALARKIFMITLEQYDDL